MKWFKDYADAEQAEAAVLYGKIQQKLQSGGTVILTRQMYRQYEAAANAGKSADRPVVKHPN
jgi:hypothetical protein